MTNSLVIDVNTPNTSTMSVDVTSPDLLSVEIPIVSGFSVDMTPTPTMTIDFVSGSVKGDKGDKGDPGIPGSTDRPFSIAMAVALS